MPLLGWWFTGLFDLDEGFYGAITAEMNRRGEWITPYYNGQPWFEKPILLYWLAKPCLWLFGDQVGPRIPSILAAAAIYGLLYWFAKRRLAPGSEVWAPLICGSSLLMVGSGRMMLTDPLLVVSITAAVLTYLEATKGDPKWLVATGAALGCGVLAKGPVAIILFAIPFLYAVIRPKLRPNVPFMIAGIAAMLLVIASWYVPCYLQNREVFVQKFLIEQNLNRFTGGDEAHSLGWKTLPFYIPILILGFLPWTLFLKRAWLERADDTGVKTVLWAWAIGSFIFFSISSAKLVHYVLPCLPPLSLLVADALVRQPKRTLKLAFGSIAVMTVFANVGFVIAYVLSGQSEAHQLIRKAKTEGGEVAMYQLGRRENDKGTGGTQIKETSLPSLFLYLNSTALDTDDLDKIIAAKPRWIFTRTNRLTADQIQSIGGTVKESGPNYRLIELNPP